MNSYLTLASTIRGYVQRQVTLRELEEWLVPRLPIFLENPDTEVGMLAGAIELNLAELQAGIITERTLRSRLARRIRQDRQDPVFLFLHGGPTLTDTTDTANVLQPTVVPWAYPSPV